tara:strand:- start:1108 stop:1719 length:612 start_codon:yes stop_codon:yes gene_type:complete
MRLKKILLLSWIILLSLQLHIFSENKIEHRIAVLVNEELITSYDIVQRMKLSAIIQKIDITTENNQLFINDTVDDLIHEKLKIEKINEYKIKIDESEYIEFETNFFLRSGLDKNQIIKQLSNNSIPFNELEKLLINELSWNKLINGLYFRLTSVSNQEIDEIISRNPNISDNQAKNLVIQRQLDLQSSKMLRDMINEATIEYR